MNIRRIGWVSQRCGLSIPTIYRLTRAGRFPKSVRIGDRAVGWVEAEVDDWIAAKVSGQRGPRPENCTRCCAERAV